MKELEIEASVIAQGEDLWPASLSSASLGGSPGYYFTQNNILRY